LIVVILSFIRRESHRSNDFSLAGKAVRAWRAGSWTNSLAHNPAHLLPNAFSYAIVARGLELYHDSGFQLRARWLKRRRRYENTGLMSAIQQGGRFE